MSQHVAVDVEAFEKLDWRVYSWTARRPLESKTDSDFLTLNARAVEFIAKPGRIQELRDCLRGRVMEPLKRRHGFAGAIVLTSHREPR
jgi:hypothetical protein